ncbi:hypothetical protein KY333_04110 [Candidatus Woesearchaeota archaeon]|nr:hypothetical protein [Candidatus Woesearchaeota archaeon]
MQAKKSRLEQFDALPFIPQKHIHISEEMDIDQISQDEDLLEGMQPWEQAFELGAQMASDEMDEVYEN